MIEIGQSIGNYNVTAKLGEGGMGVVYLVEHPVIGRKAALKAIHPHLARNVDVVSRFLIEAKSVNQIGHRNIVDITDFGTTATDDFYFIMEHLEGESLADTIDEHTRLATHRALHIAAQIADALQASHDSGVIHRDLKPDNVFLVSRGDDADFVKVLDFGLAKLSGLDGAPTHNTETGSVLGTPYYMAPEQCEGKVDVDHRADVYSLGIIVFEMLTGKLPFAGTGFGEVILKHMTVPAPLASSVVPELPPALDAILLRALAKDPAERFQSMTELQTALRDPAAYLASLPELGPDDALPRAVRTACPMVRSEMSLPRTVSSDTSSDPSGAPAVSTRSRRPTLREGGGEVGKVDAVGAPRRRRARGVAVAALAASVFVMLAPATYKHPVAGVVAAAEALTSPSKVRLNFSSDPAGATVVRADGTVLGVTPLSTEAPYAEAATAFVFRKEGFVAKTVSLVPNLPAPLFVVLQREALPDPPLSFN